MLLRLDNCTNDHISRWVGVVCCVYHPWVVLCIDVQVQHLIDIFSICREAIVAQDRSPAELASQPDLSVSVDLLTVLFQVKHRGTVAQNVWFLIRS